MGHDPHGQSKIIGRTDGMPVGEEDDGTGKLPGASGFRIEVFRRCKIIVLRAIAYLCGHVEPLFIGKTIGNGLADPIVSAAVVPDVNDYSLAF